MRGGNLWRFALSFTFLVSASAAKGQDATPQSVPPAPGPAATMIPPAPVVVPPPPPKTAATYNPAPDSLVTTPAGDLPPLNLKPRPTTIFLDFEYLVLSAKRPGIDLGIVAPANDGTPNGSTERLDWRTSSGYRIGGGLRPSEKNWDVGAFYTYFDTNRDRELFAPAGGAILPTQLHPFGVAQADSVIGSSSFRYDTVDVEVGRRVTSCDDLSLRLVGGGKFVWMQQRHNLLFNGGDARNATYSAPLDFNGGGIRAGADAVWNLGGRFSLFAKAYGSLLVGNFRLRVQETNNNGAFILTDVTEKFDQVVPALEMMVGGSYCIGHSKLSLGYQITNYFQMINSFGFVDDVAVGRLSRNYGNVSLDGLTARFEVEF